MKKGGEEKAKVVRTRPISNAYGFRGMRFERPFIETPEEARAEGARMAREVAKKLKLKLTA